MGFKFANVAALFEELELRGRGLQPLTATTTASTATVSTKTEPKKNSKASLEIKEDAIKDNEETVLELLNCVATRKILRVESEKILKTTPGEGDEGFEGPPYKQSLEEDDANEASKKKDDAIDASKNVKSLSKEAEEDDDETLGDNAENRAAIQVVANAVDPVKSDPEKAG